jgi:hypothetical protein
VRYIITLLAATSFAFGAWAQSATPQSDERFTQGDPTKDPSAYRRQPQGPTGPMNTQSRPARTVKSQGATQSTPTESTRKIKTNSSDWIESTRY